jgi:predicted O-methyltransferase YrrM
MSGAQHAQPGKKKQPSPDLPWLMPEVIDWLVSLQCLGPDARDTDVLETGAGGSTVFFAQRATRVTTYEDNPMYAAHVRQELAKRKIDNVELRFRPNYPTEGLGKLWTVDLAFIDGRGRVRSMADAVPLVKAGGWIILDDSQRGHYGEALHIADNVASTRIVFRSGPDETTAWRKA